MKAKQIFMYALGALVVIAFFAVIYLLIFNGVPAGNDNLLNISIGALLASFSTVVGYFYGSSLGSAEKNEILKNGQK